MAAIAAEPLSPELALVCPELRARAIAALPELPWLAVRRSRPDEPTETENDPVLAPFAPIYREAAAYALARAGQLGAAAAGVIFLMLALTILAAVRY